MIECCYLLKCIPCSRACRSALIHVSLQNYCDTFYFTLNWVRRKCIHFIGITRIFVKLLHRQNWNTQAIISAFILYTVIFFDYYWRIIAVSGVQVFNLHALLHLKLRCTFDNLQSWTKIKRNKNKKWNTKQVRAGCHSPALRLFGSIFMCKLVTLGDRQPVFVIRHRANLVLIVINQFSII